VQHAYARLTHGQRKVGRLSRDIIKLCVCAQLDIEIYRDRAGSLRLEI
jgi:hypothetical protein